MISPIETHLLIVNRITIFIDYVFNYKKYFKII